MDIEEIRRFTLDQLEDELIKLKREQFNLRFQKATAQLNNTARVREVRRTIARIKTVERQKRGPKRRVKDNEDAEARFAGVVVSDKNDKTVVVKVERRLTHPVLKKTVRLSKNIMRMTRAISSTKAT